MRDIIQEVLNILRAAGAIPRTAEPQSVSEYPPGDTDLAFRFSVPTPNCTPALAQKCRGTIVRNIERCGNYINIKLSAPQLADKLLAAVDQYSDNYGFDRRLDGARFIVEHTSLNPVYPLNVATFRSSALGNALARLLRLYGAAVETHFWIEDESRHLAVVACGLRSLGTNISNISSVARKGDHAIGSIFAATLFRATDSQFALDGGVLTRMFPLAGIQPQIPRGISATDLHTFRGDKDEVLHICNCCIRGFNETLDATGIRIDKYDFESSYLGNDITSRVLALAQENTGTSEDTRSYDGSAKRHLSYYLRNAIYYAHLIGEAPHVISVVSARQEAIARASAALAERAQSASGQSVRIVCFGDVHCSDNPRDSVKQGVFHSVDAVLAGHADQLGQPISVIGAGLKFALLRCNPGRTCILNASAATVHKDFMRIIGTVETLDRGIGGVSTDVIESGIHNEATIALLKRIAVFPRVLDRVLKSGAYHGLAKHVVDLAADVRRYIGNRKGVPGGHSRRLLAASRATLVNGLCAMGIDVLSLLPMQGAKRGIWTQR